MSIPPDSRSALAQCKDVRPDRDVANHQIDFDVIHFVDLSRVTSMRSMFLAKMTRSTPSAANVWQQAEPSPELPPITKARLPAIPNPHCTFHTRDNPDSCHDDATGHGYL